MAPFSDHTAIGAFQAGNNANGMYVPPPPVTGNPYYQARFDGVQGYTHHAESPQPPLAVQQAAGSVLPDNALLGRPPRGAGGVAEGLQSGAAAVGGCHCTGAASQGFCGCGAAGPGGMQWGSNVQQQGAQTGATRARGSQRQAFAVGEAGYGARGMQGPPVYTPGDVAMVPQAHGGGRRRKNRSVEDYVGASSKLADEWDDPAFSYGGGPHAGTPQAGTGGIRHELQDPAALQQQPLLGPSDLVRRITYTAFPPAPKFDSCNVTGLAIDVRLL